MSSGRRVAIPHWPGCTVVCLGGGPSLTHADVSFCRERQVRILAINDAHRMAPFADVLYTSDLAWLTYYDGVPGFGGPKFTIEREPGRGRREHERWPDWTVLRHTGDTGIEPDPSGLRTGRNSGAAAINLAVHLGATRIVLLGYDMGCDNPKMKHWFGEHPRELQADSPFASFVEMFQTMVTPLHTLGIDVVNSSRRTALTAFPKIPLKEALG